MSLDLRISNLETAVRRMVPSEQDPSTTTASSSSGSGIPHFLDSKVEVQAITTSDVDWTTFDAHSWIPAGSCAAIIETEYAISEPDSGDDDATILFRKQSGSIELVGSRGRASGSADDIAGANQLLVPITSTRTFDFAIEEPGFNEGATIHLIGYWK